MSIPDMKIISFNINGLRARLHQLQAIIDKHQPDVIGLQAAFHTLRQLLAGGGQPLGFR